MKTTLAALLWVVPAAGGYAQVSGLTTSNDYAHAIYAVIQMRWEPDSYNSELAPDSSCAVQIVQMPGGDILSIDVLPSCDFNQAGRAIAVEAVRRSGPLPYRGFEGVYQREIRFVFHAASAGDRKARGVAQVANAQVAKRNAESDRQWEATVGRSMRQAEYANQCSFHLLREMPRIKLPHPIAVIVTVDKLGKAVRVAGVSEEPYEPLMAALKATSPCDPVPSDLITGMGTIQIGPMIVRDFGD